MSPDADPDRRRRQDRRGSRLPFWHLRRLQGRRGRNRREVEDGRPLLVERVGAFGFTMAVLLLLLTIADGLLTVALLDHGCEEANPLLRVLLDRGTAPFFVGKYVLIAAFLPIALVLDRHRLFGTGLRVGHLAPIFVALYVVLLAYQYSLWSSATTDGVATEAPISIKSRNARLMGAGRKSPGCHGFGTPTPCR